LTGKEEDGKKPDATTEPLSDMISGEENGI
jgi:hypothetical protein